MIITKGFLMHSSVLPFEPDDCEAVARSGVSGSHSSVLPFEPDDCEAVARSGVSGSHSKVLWQRPGLKFPTPFDTILFDVDGVLIKTIDSFHATDIATAEYVAGTLHRLDWGQHEGKLLFTHDDVLAFKQAGGYNNDWDMCYLLSTLGTARLREWKGTSIAERSSEEWGALSRAANLEGHGGNERVGVNTPSNARLTY